MSRTVGIEFSYRLFNPLFYHIKYCMENDDLRIILNIGGSSSGKSFACAQAALYASLREGCNILVLRKVGSSVSRSIYMDFETVIKSWGSSIRSVFECVQNEIRNKINGSKISFSGLDDSEKIKGISQYKYIILDELTEFEYEDFKQLRKRMRGIKGQKMICNFNPISELHWIKKQVIDAETWTPRCPIARPDFKGFPWSKYTEITSKESNQERTIINPITGDSELHPSDMVLLKTTYLNNFWVVGSPCGKFGFYDRQTVADFEKDKIRDYDYYRIYALAEWGVIRTGGEFLYNFDEKRNIGNISYDATRTIRLSIDNNVLPYISIGVWQLIDDKLYQIKEIAAEEPNNTVTDAAILTCQYLDDIGYNDLVIIHADASTTARNTIDDNKQSFIDKFADVLVKYGFNVKLSMPRKNPSVALSCEFVNKLLFDGRIVVHNECKKSILDYLNSKRDANGGMMKKRIRDKVSGQTYEQWGHFTDTLRYVGTYAFADEYIKFSASRNRNPIKENDYKFYDVKPEGGMVYTEIYPNINGSMVVVGATRVENKIYIQDIILTTPYEHGFDSPLVRGEVCVRLTPTTLNALWSIRRNYENVKDVYVRGKRDRGRHAEKADTYIPYIKENVYLHKNIGEDVINNILDYDGVQNYEVVCAIATLCERILGNKAA